MKKLEVEFIATRETRRSFTDWISEDELEATRTDAAAHGFTLRVVGEVSWQRQLACMENPEL